MANNVERKTPSLVNVRNEETGEVYRLEADQVNRVEVNGVGNIPPKDSGLLNPVIVTAKGNNTNILHNFRNFTYLFTLSALKNESLRIKDGIKKSSDQLVIAKSAGKTTSAIDPASTKNDSAKKLIEEFNKSSPGRFDLFMNNVEIETLMTFSQNTNLTMATKISFEIYEPMSINGFMEALQVSCVAAGHKSYMGAPLLLKIEFVGYTDEDDNSIETNVSPRYFIISITKVDVELTELGTRYMCSAVAHSEMGYADTNNLKQSIKMVGETVGEVLYSLEVELNNALVNEANREQKPEEPIIVDSYEFVFPTPTETGYDYNKTYEQIVNSKIVHPKTDPVNVNVGNAAVTAQAQATQARAAAAAGNAVDCGPSPAATTTTTTPTIAATPAATPAAPPVPIQAVTTFAAGTKIHDIVSSVIRSSEFSKNIIRNPVSSIVNDQFFEYVHVAIEVIPKGESWSPKLNRPVYLYRYIILPYKIHYTQTQLYPDKVNTNQLKKYVRRSYNYLYTGKNVDIRTFNMKFNNLFYQAYAKGLGKPLFASTSDSDVKDPEAAKGLPTSDSAAKIMPTQPVKRADTSLSSVVAIGGNTGPRSYDTYDMMVTTMHQAILDNTAMISCEMEILGDPYYLCTGGIGINSPEIKIPGITTNGEAPYKSGVVIISIDFRNPDDIESNPTDPNYGMVRFNKNKIPFSGCFRVNSVTSRFSDGVFTQRLRLLRLPNQSEENREVSTSTVKTSITSFENISTTFA